MTTDTKATLSSAKELAMSSPHIASAQIWNERRVYVTPMDKNAAWHGDRSFKCWYDLAADKWFYDCAKGKRSEAFSRNCEAFCKLVDARDELNRPW